MNHSGSPGIRAVDVWDIIKSAIVTAGSIGLRLLDTGLNFYDEFTRTDVNAEVWAVTHDGTGSWTPSKDDGMPTCWKLKSGNVIDNDSFIDGDDLIGNKYFSPNESVFDTVSWETRLKIDSIADISIFWGLLRNAVASYSEPNLESIIFFADPAVNANFNARSRGVAEEETDTGIALDTDFHIFRIDWTATSVLFYIDDVLVATHVTQVPIKPAITQYLIRTEAAANKTMFIDYLRVEMS